MVESGGRTVGGGAWRGGLVVLAAALAACGPVGSAQPPGDDAPAGGSRDAAPARDAGGGAVAFDAADGGGPGPDETPDAAACAASSTRGQRRPLDIFIMLDQSRSMSDTVTGGLTKWSAVTGALTAFAAQGSAGIAIGLQYFGLPPSSGAGSWPAGYSDSCAAADYATPDVAIAPLPGVAVALAASLATHSPRTATPTSAALAGAVLYAQGWAAAHPADVTLVVFATDGDPTECDQVQADIDAIAAAGAAGAPPIATFVIGVGSLQANLDAIAAAGGSGQALMVDTGGDVTQQFLAALNAIRGSALGCTYAIPSPDGGTPDFSRLNVQYTPGGGGAPQLVPQVTGAAACPASGAAWYYDNPAAPTTVVLCPATCATVSADGTGEVDLLLGCATEVVQ